MQPDRAAFFGGVSLRKTVMFLLLACLVATPALAQQRRGDVGVFFGWTFSEGVEVDPDVAEGVHKVSPTSGMSYGFDINAFVTEQLTVGFLFNQQLSDLEIGGVNKQNVADLKVNNYHGTVAYHFGFDSDTIRPFLYGGLGATQYSPGDVMGNNIDGATKFSSTWGGGVKIYPNRNVGVNLTARWTPTFIDSDPAGLWCSPYWYWGGCFVVEELKYSHQFQLAAGLTFGF